MISAELLILLNINNKISLLPTRRYISKHSQQTASDFLKILCQQCII